MIRIDATHNGPSGSGHGGVTAGKAAELVDPWRAVVRLHVPIPLETPLIPVGRPGGTVELRSRGVRVATARPLDRPLDVDRFEPLPAELVAWAEQAWLGGAAGVNYGPTCFGCGPDRRPGDGLGLRPGPVAGYGVHATRWVPASSGEVPPWLVWAALDCAGAGPAMAACGPGEAAVTGELAVEIHQPIDGLLSWRLVSRQRRRSGRKVLTESALVDPDGRPVAVSVATWFKVPAASAAPGSAA